jgi:hypothetical protein
LAKELSNERIVRFLREVGDVKRRLPGERDLDLDVVDPLLVLCKGAKDGILCDVERAERSGTLDDMLHEAAKISQEDGFWVDVLCS